MHIYETGGSDPSFRFSITYGEIAGGWELAKVEVVHEGVLLECREHKAAFFHAKVMAIWHGVAECEAFVQKWRLQQRAEARPSPLPDSVAHR